MPMPFKGDQPDKRHYFWYRRPPEESPTHNELYGMGKRYRTYIHTMRTSARPSPTLCAVAKSTCVCNETPIQQVDANCSALRRCLKKPLLRLPGASSAGCRACAA
eukprot:scaffold374443_cov34-Prasinocladus_malaysianus.AAC.1